MKHMYFVLFSLFIGPQLLSQDFVQWRGVNRDGKYDESSLLKNWPENGPEMLWHFDDLGEGHGSAAVTSDIVYTTGTLNEITYVFALTHQGKLIWKSKVGRGWVESWPGVRTTPLIKDHKLYLMTGYGLIVCMNAESGEMLWQVDIMKDYDGRNIVWGMCENLLIEDEKIFCTVGGLDANVIALNKNSGKLIWKSKAKCEKSAYNTPGLIEYGGMKILITMTEFSILGINAENGKLLWSHKQTNQYSVHANSPLFKDGKLYVVSGYGRGGVMLQLSDDGKSISELWRNVSMDSRMGGVILDNGRIYGGGDKSRKWVCLDWNTGDELYSSKEVSSGNLIMADGLLYWYGTKGEVALVEPTNDSFKVISKFKVPYGSAQHWAHLVIANKKLYVRHGNSMMVYSIVG
ncbi:MAG: PQQ-like beta-propeller repeat protein [Bacteroidetes bacterium]|nr:PQQ-like beta-propeller repeat protein [Bacteroidota bacterium]